MLLTLTNPSIEDPNRRRDWAKAIKTIWTQTLSLLLNVELPEQTAKEMEMLEYYQNVVKNSELKLFKDKMGKLHVSGVDKLLQKP